MKRAFTLIEIMVAVAMLTLIIFALLQAFNTTQKAMISGTTQIDVLETGRVASEMIGRELEQATTFPNGAPFFKVTNFATNVWPQDAQTTRTNILGVVAFWKSEANHGHRVAYFENRPDSNGVAELWRMEGTNNATLAEGVVAFNVTPLDASGRPTTNTSKLPSAVIVELALLEKRTLERYHSFSNTPAALTFLTNQTAHLHVFRQRITVRAAQP